MKEMCKKSKGNYPIIESEERCNQTGCYWEIRGQFWHKTHMKS